MKEENKDKLKMVMNIMQVLLTSVSILLIITFRETSITISYTAVLLLWLANCIFCLKKVKERILLLLFHGAFFAFLMGRETVNLLQTGNVAYDFDVNIQFHIIICLYLSLASLACGFKLIEKYLKEQKTKETQHLLKLEVNREELRKTIRKYAKITFCIGWILNIFVAIEQTLYVVNHSYLEFAKSFSSQIPYIIRIIANFRTIAFFIFLATIPEKKETKPMIFMYIIEAIGSLAFGDRGNCIINILIVIAYIVFRQWKNKEEKWITKKQVIIIVILIPFVLAFLSGFVYLREGTDIGSFNVANQILRFFKSIGNSVNIIGHEKAYESQLNEIGTFYTIGDLKQYLIYNPITEKIFHVQNITYHTEEYALSGQSFMHTISYLIDPANYIEGHGYGSSYIAELHIDFGYIGVILGNVLIGAYMAIFYKIYNKNCILTGCLLLSYRIMFFIPRAPVDYLITYVLNFTAIASISVITVLTILEIKYKNYKGIKEIKNGG